MHFHSLHNSASDVPQLPCSLTPCFLLPLTSLLSDEFILLKDLHNQMSFLPLMLSLQLWILSTNLLLVSMVFYFPGSPQESSSPLPFLPSVSSPCCLFCPVTPLFSVTDCLMRFFTLPVGSSPHFESPAGQLHSSASPASPVGHVTGSTKHILFYFCRSTQAGNSGTFLLLLIHPFSQQSHLVSYFRSICNKICSV